jgi:serine/threonine protein phosphatase 1
MEKARSIFIWDIHWCYDEFKLLLEKIALKKEDIVYIVWDLINKWPKSYEVLEFIYENKNQFIAIMWNHELNFINYLKNPNSQYSNDFLELKSKIEKNNKTFLIDYIKNLPLYIEKDDFLMIHWWLIPWKKANELSAEEITRLREYEWNAWYEYYKWNKKIIYWHRAADWLKVRNNTIWLDSWCLYWNYLSAYILETEEIIQQKAIKAYVEIIIK